MATSAQSYGRSRGVFLLVHPSVAGPCRNSHLSSTHRYQQGNGRWTAPPGPDLDLDPAHHPGREVSLEAAERTVITRRTLSADP